jgi:hypothetical protein
MPLIEQAFAADKVETFYIGLDDVLVDMSLSEVEPEQATRKGMALLYAIGFVRLVKRSYVVGPSPCG